MSLRNQFGIVALLLAGLILVAGAAVQAREPVPNTDFPLICTSTAPTKAAGHAYLTQIYFEGFAWTYIDEPGWGWTCDEVYTANLKVTCTGLKPSTTYTVFVGGQTVDVKTDRSGAGTASRPVNFGFVWWYDEGGNLVTSGPDFPFEVRVSTRARSGTVMLWGDRDYSYFNRGRIPPEPTP
jgi:hypothetical protein